MFIRKKLVNGTTYYAVVENHRPRNEDARPKRWRKARDGRVKQRTVVSLGRCSTIAAALVEARKYFALWQQQADLGRQVYLVRRQWLNEKQSVRHRDVSAGRVAEKRAAWWRLQISKLEAAHTVVSKGTAK